MASEAVLKELFEASKVSLQFKGISEEDIWKACQAYSDRADGDIKIAMENIRKKDQVLLDKADEQKRQLEKGKEKIVALHHQEEAEREKDTLDAEKVLEELFNK